MYDRSNYDYISRRYIIPEFMRFIESDEDPGEILGSQLENRGKVYTKLIDDYAKITKIRNGCKEFHKWAFFWLIVLVGGIVVYMGCQIVQRVLSMEEADKFLEATPIIITVFATLLSSIIGIPLTITRFLFNEKEDENITKTIFHTQLHDFKEINLLRDRYTKPPKNNNPNPPDGNKRSKYIFDEEGNDIGEFSTIGFDDEWE